MSYIGIIITYVFISNFVLTQFLGMCPFLGVSKNIESAVGMGFAVTFVATMASLVTWLVQHYILVPLNIAFLQTVAFILVIAALVQIVEMVLQKFAPPLYKALGLFLPLMTTNCAILGVAVIAVRANYNALESFTAGFACGVGFLLAIFVMSTIRERIATEDIPKPFRGIPIAFIIAGLMAMSFMAFDKALLKNLIG
ncbi:MAG: RnfABCDGE type electron transport complex subunit A [Spirochaetaceae bacterium]|nr:RnfABCDGE type electron transport complex subunit A [Spirochaetaceae bacterium]